MRRGRGERRGRTMCAIKYLEGFWALEKMVLCFYDGANTSAAE